MERMMDPIAEIEDLKAEVKILKHVLGTALSWMPNASGIPLSLNEVAKLLKMLDMGTINAQD